MLLTSSPGCGEATITVDSSEKFEKGKEIKKIQKKNLLFDVMHGSSLSMSIKPEGFQKTGSGRFPFIVTEILLIEFSLLQYTKVHILLHSTYD